MRSLARKLHGRRPSPAMVVSIIALVMASTGTAFAAKAIIKSTKQIKAGVVNSTDVKDAALKGRDVKDGSLTLGDFEASARSTISGAQTAATEVFRKSGPEGVPAGDERRIATVTNLEPGVYALFAKTVLTPKPDPNGGGILGGGNGASGRCVLGANEDRDEARNLLAPPGYDAPSQFNMQLTVTLNDPSTVSLDCQTADREWRASDTSIIAIRVAKAPRQSVDG